MGTRGLVCVVSDKTYKVASYSQFDSYPGGVGSDVLSFLRNKFNGAIFKENLSKCTSLTQEDIKARWVLCGADASTSFVTTEVSDKFKARYPQLHREAGANVLGMIQDSPQGLDVSVSSLNFAADSLFCEWCYVIDLDLNTFEVYKGFQETPLDPEDRFYFLQKKSEKDKYYPVSLAISYSFDSLPDEDDFISFFNDEEEEGAT